MKNYRFLVPLLLIGLYAGSIFMLRDDRMAVEKQYLSTLETAREYRAQDIQIDAEKYYLSALDQKPSVELSVEIGEFYWDSARIGKALDWGEEMVDLYPEEPAVYEFLMTIYEKRKEYSDCFALADSFQKRGLQSAVVTELLDRIEYEFFFNGEYDDVTVFSGSRCPVLRAGKWGYVGNAAGRVIATQYAYVGPFAGGLAPVTDLEGNCYYVDSSGNKKHVVLGVEHIERLGLMEDGLFSLYDGTQWHFYNTDHELVFGGFEDASSTANGVAAVKQNGMWHFVDRKGNDLTGSTYQGVLMDEKGVVFRNGRAFVSDGTGYRMITQSGETVGNTVYEDARLFNDATYAAVKINGKWGFIDKDANLVIEPQYENARSFANGMAAIRLGCLWGFIDQQGNILIEPQFEDARDFTDAGSVFVFRNGEWNLLRLYKLNH